MIIKNNKRNKDVSICVDINFKEEEEKIMFENSNTGDWVENINQIQTGWSFQDEKDQIDFEMLINEIATILDDKDFIQMVHDSFEVEPLENSFEWDNLKIYNI